MMRRHAAALSPQQLVAAERRPFGGSAARGGLSACVLYPNDYSAAMSSLAFQTLYGLLESNAGFACSRAFAPQAAGSNAQGGCLLIGSDGPLAAIDLVAVTTSYELDWLHLPRCLAAGGVAPLRRDRDAAAPFLLGGGPCFTANPAPVLDLFDAVYIGEIEPALPDLRGLHNIPRAQWREYLAQRPGFLVPGITVEPVRRVCLRDLSEFTTATVVLTPHTEFSDSFVVELGRGCGRACSFCMAGALYRPLRYRTPAQILAAVDTAMAHTDRIGLLSASVTDYPGLDELCAGLQRLRPLPSVSASSMRADGDNRALYELLAASGQRTVTFAPETGTERLRTAVRKQLTDEQLREGIAQAVAAGLHTIKLYFMTGLPDETEADLEAIPRLVESLVAEFSSCTWSVGVQPFVPKPHTCLERARTPDIRTMREHLKTLDVALRSVPGVAAQAASARWSAVQTALSRGDSRLGEAIVEASLRGADFSALRRLFADAGHELDAMCAPMADDAARPWDIVVPTCADAVGA